MIRESIRTVQFIVFLGSCLALSSLLADLALAEDEFEVDEAAPKTELGIAQASEDDVRGRFGPPDGIQAESEGATWRYGRSAIFFSHGTVRLDRSRDCRSGRLPRRCASRSERLIRYPQECRKRVGATIGKRLRELHRKMCSTDL